VNLEDVAVHTVQEPWWDRRNFACTICLHPQLFLIGNHTDRPISGCVVYPFLRFFRLSLHVCLQDFLLDQVRVPVCSLLLGLSAISSSTHPRLFLSNYGSRFQAAIRDRCGDALCIPQLVLGNENISWPAQQIR
jgi:hypothetical protein